MSQVSQVGRGDSDKNPLDGERQQVLPNDEIVVAPSLTTSLSAGIIKDLHEIHMISKRHYLTLKESVSDVLATLNHLLPEPQNMIQSTIEALDTSDDPMSMRDVVVTHVADYYRGLRNNQAGLVRSEILNLLDDIDDDVESVGKVTRSKGVRSRLAGPTIYAIASMVIEKHGNLDCSKEINSKTVREFIRRDDECRELFNKINRTDKEPAIRRIMNLVTIPSKITLEEMRAIKPYGWMDRLRWRCSYLGSCVGLDNVPARMAEYSNFVGKP